MVEIILTTLKDILNGEKDLLRDRYEGDFEYNQFRSHLRWRRKAFVIVNIVLLSLVALAFFKISIVISFQTITQFLMTADFFSMLIIIGLLLFSFISLYNLYISWKYLKFKNLRNSESKRSLTWNNWQFKDIIFRKAVLLDEKYKIDYRRTKNKKYCLYLILQYDDGSFGWYNLTNNPKLVKDHILKDRNERIIHFEKAIRKDSEFVSESHKDVIQHMKKEKLCPKLIVGIRIRSNIQNQKIEINNLNFRERV
ncbi:hypothetical protein HYW21_02405 [Candidatus Woesearchaeota archaeon]|nr:hypothetical protein [Candidatus Woesearchaeota archaeon]